MITIAGKKYAKNNAELVDSLFQTGGTCAGFYRKQGNGVLLMDLQEVPFAFIAHRGMSCWFVTAHRTEDGRTRYMFGLAEYTAERLGIQELTYSQQSYAAECVIGSL